MAKLSHIEEKVDARTGEVVTITKSFSVKSKNKDEFFFTFLDALNAVCKISRSSDLKVLAIMCGLADFNKGTVRLSAEGRKSMMKSIGCNTQSLTNSLTRLRKAGLIVGSRGDYEINPQYFWKGTTDERNKMLKEKNLELHLKFSENDGKPQV
jgi:hypothetical protein